MDFGSIIGILIALIGIIGGQLIEGGYIGSMLQTAAFLIVFCGTAGAVMVQSPVRVFVRGIRMARWVVMPPKFEPRQVINDVVRWSASARKAGLLALDQQAEVAGFHLGPVHLYIRRHPFAARQAGYPAGVAVVTQIARLMRVVGAALMDAAVELVTLQTTGMLKLAVQGIAEFHCCMAVGSSRKLGAPAEQQEHEQDGGMKLHATSFTSSKGADALNMSW